MMNELGIALPFHISVLLWLAKTVIYTVIASFLAWVGIRILDVITPDIPERRRIGQSPVAIGLFVAGFFIFLGLVIHGAVTAPAVIGGPVLAYLFDLRRLGLLAASFLVSVLIFLFLFFVIDKCSPHIPFQKMKEDPVAVGVYMFGYLIFFGLVLHASLSSPL
jgi:uncharacterized membrane protein YjfL (UPF0719 family)